MSDLLGLLAYGPTGWGDEILIGIWLTVRLALVTLPLGLLIGFLVALAKDSGEPSLVLAGDIFTTIFRGLPELLTLFIVYYGGQIVLQQIVAFFTDTYVEISGFTAGVVALGLVFSAFSSEVFLGALRGIPKGQYEGGKALGLTGFQITRLVIIPQLFRLALPGLTNLWLVLLKDTALVSVIALDDLLRKTNIAVGVTKEPFFFYGVACMIYLVMSMISSAGLSSLERRVNKSGMGH
ncbi:MAG: ABC transporter permease [Hyphomicrobiales bacterium]|nr:MAG: ABC transporter permease [Hyphomicrobiales bacterium]